MLNWFKTRGKKEPVKHSSWGPYQEEPVVFDHADKVKERIKAQGLEELYEILLPAHNELQLDYDQTELPPVFFDALDTLAQTVEPTQVVQYYVRKSRSGNLHASVFVPNHTFSKIERIAWQAVFGSDLKREALSLKSVALKQRNPSLLVEKIGNPVIDSGCRGNLKPEPVGRKFR